MAPTQHSKFSFSSSSRWINCPASLRLIEENQEIIKKYEAKKDNSAAEQGTKAHALLEDLLRYGKYPSLKEDLEMREHVLWAAQCVKEIVPQNKKLKDLFLIEKKVHLTKEAYGTADCIIYNSFLKELNIVDFKYGVHTVLAKENPQLTLYALAAMETLGLGADVDVIRLHVLQPRHMSGQRSWSEWKVDNSWLAKFIESVYYAMEPTNSNLFSQPKTGEHCRWCPAKVTCPAQQIEVINAFKALTAEEQILNRIAKLYEKREQIEEWFKAAEVTLISELESGKLIDGVRLKQGVTRFNYNKDLEVSEIVQGLEELGFDKEEILKNEKKLLPLSVIRSKVGMDELKKYNIVSETVTKTTISFGESFEKFEFEAVDSNE